MYFQWLKIKRLFEFHSSAIQLNQKFWFTIKEIQEQHCGSEGKLCGGSLVFARTISVRNGLRILCRLEIAPNERYPIRITFTTWTNCSRFRCTLSKGLKENWWCRFYSSATVVKRTESTEPATISSDWAIKNHKERHCQPSREFLCEFKLASKVR